MIVLEDGTSDVYSLLNSTANPHFSSALLISAFCQFQCIYVMNEIPVNTVRVIKSNSWEVPLEVIVPVG